MYKNILKIVGVLILGALGALLFNFFLLPYMLTNSYFERFQFVKDFKQGKIIVNQKETVYIQENTAIQEAVLKVEKSIVVVESEKLGVKSGLIVTSDGLVVTLANAIPADGKFNVFLGGENVNFKVVKVDSKNNLALIKIDKNNLQTVGFVSYDKIKLGQKVFMVAPTSEKQDNWLVNEGIVREINGNIIKTNISEGKIASSSPLFNTVGELFGLNFIDSDTRISAVSIQKIKEFLGL